MIPKTIHYCWFGGAKKPKLAMKCIKSWKKYCKDYEFIEWNESNFDISTAPKYVQQAYEQKKWAFVTDFVRLYAIYNQGGIYLDTDVEILKNVDNLLDCTAFFGREDGGYVSTGLGFGAVPRAEILSDLMEEYYSIDFIKSNGELDMTPCPIRNTKHFIEKGLNMSDEVQALQGDVIVYGEEYFSPKNYRTGQLNITENTFAIHHYDASWLPDKVKAEQKRKLQSKLRKEKRKKIRRAIKESLVRVIGVANYERIRKLLH